MKIPLFALGLMACRMIHAESIRGADFSRDEKAIMDEERQLTTDPYTRVVTWSGGGVKYGPKNLFLLKHQSTGKVLDVFKAGCSDNQNIQIWEENWTTAQLFYWDTRFRLINARCNKAVDMHKNVCEDDRNAQLYPKGSTSAQIFKITEEGTEAFALIKNSCSLGLSVQDGRNVVLGDVTNANSKWQIHYIRPFQLAALQGVAFSGGNKHVLGVAAPCNTNANVEAQVVAGSPSNNWGQVFYLDHKDRIVSFQCHKPLDATNNRCAADTNVKLWNANDSGAQNWNLDTSNTDSMQAITLKGCGMALGFGSISSSEGGNVHLCSGRDTCAWDEEVWTLKYVDL